MMTYDEVKKQKDAFAEVMALLQAIQEGIYVKAMRLFDKEAAQAASYEIIGGLSKMWDKVCDEGHIICMVVTCPSAADYDQMKENEEDLRKLIYTIDPQLINFLLDIFTSRLEMGKVGESTVTCRWPIYLGESVNNLADSLCIVKIGTHRLNAWTYFKGKAQVLKTPVDRWLDVTIGGEQIAEISPEELQSRPWKQLDADALTTNLEKHYNAMLEAEAQDGGWWSKHIWTSEFDKVKTLRTWAIAQDIIHEQNGSNARNLAMLKMAGEIISDFNSDYGQCTAFDALKPWISDTEAFMNLGLESFYLTFDPVLHLAMAGNASGTIKQDAPGKVNAALCIQFALSTGDNVTFSMLGAGIICVQHCIPNPNRLVALAHLMQEQLPVSAIAIATESASRLTCAAAAAPPVPQIKITDGSLTAPADGIEHLSPPKFRRWVLQL